MAEDRLSSIERLQEGIKLFRMKNWDSALKEFLQVNTGDFGGKDSVELSYYLGLCYTKLARYDDALVFLEQVVTTGDDLMRVYQCRMTLAYIYAVTKRAKMAEFELKRLMTSGFESPILYNTLAYAAWVQRQYKNSVEFYEKALEIDEDNTTAMNGLGYVLADSGMDRIRGLSLCRKAVDKKPQSAACLDSLGWAYYKNGEMLEARTWLRRALDLAPDEKVIRDHLRIAGGGG